MATAKLILCGCGWLGKYVAETLAPTMPIIGTTRHPAKMDELTALGIRPLLFNLAQITGPLKDDSSTPCLDACAGNIVVLNIPPGRKQPIATDFAQQMIALITRLYALPIKQLIFISTTSVYGDTQGILTEQSPPAPMTPSALAHVAIENHIRALNFPHYSILRLAGLVGPDRHPAKSLAGRVLSQGEQVVNLVYIDDVVSAIQKIIQGHGNQQTLHLCSQQHPQRGEYYTRAAQALGLVPPIFEQYEQMAPPRGKIIDPKTTLDTLDMELAYANPDDMY
jgi:nucleoside-diphosphate-sugar epimerase